jgi:hypothetical protein
MILLLAIAFLGLLISIFSPINFKRTRYLNHQSQLSNTATSVVE